MRAPGQARCGSTHLYPQFGRSEAKASGVQGYPWLNTRFKARLGCMMRFFQNKTRHRPFLVRQSSGFPLYRKDKKVCIPAERATETVDISRTISKGHVSQEIWFQKKGVAVRVFWASIQASKLSRRPG